ncbi:hypothetical protein CBR_g31738 [Chara braunii]|uniref:Uncharacterized protein n=1 Tax=Chara braunii TaxID=69332 RepID=A0A388JY24_CHABU|nr:hypothetical protein CBR_g31738 [Chara braunii]|eukprot:GBG62721.1 hypothetical protein CBR_g31738 [Chara braunii]
MERLQRSQSQRNTVGTSTPGPVNWNGASTSGNQVAQDKVVARLIQALEELKAKLEKRVETMEGEIRSLRLMKDEAAAEVEIWKKKALRTGNKRSRIALSPGAQLKVDSQSTPVKSPGKARLLSDHAAHAWIVELHNLEVNALKELRLQELNRRRAAEQCLAEMEERMESNGEAEDGNATFQSQGMPVEH